MQLYFGLSYHRVNLDSWALTPLACSGEFGVPDGVAITQDGTLIRHHYSKKLVQRVSPDGTVLETMKFPRLVANPIFTQNGIYTKHETAVFYWPFGNKESQPLLLAESTNTSGDMDGIGRHARFRRLRAPCFDGSRYIFVRDVSGEDNQPSRLVRIDSHTDEVRSCSVHGFQFPSDFLTMTNTYLPIDFTAQRVGPVGVGEGVLSFMFSV